MPGKPVPLIELLLNLNGSGERFWLNNASLQQIQSLNRLLHCEVSVISVAGAFRKGKSFLLNFFLRYLRALQRGDINNWIRSEDTLNDGFHWRCGSDRDTTGILVWSEPFFIRKPNGEEVAVLLMDTQGTFDHQSTQKDCTTIFAFSTLLSSVQIFNISQNIQETDLQYLRLFVEFAAMASESEERVLQHLMFLIRDWQWSDDYAFGSYGGEAYLRKVLMCDPSKPPENQELREGILKHFDRTSCYLLPHPGNYVTKKQFNGEMDGLDPEFVEELERFVPLILSPENLVVKSVNGRALTGQDLFNYLKVYFEAFRCGKLPSPKTIFAATVEMTNMAVAKTCRETFDTQVQSRVDPTTEMSEDQLDQILDSVMRGVLTQFDQKCMQRSSSVTTECRQKLVDDLHAQFQQHRRMNQLRSEKIAVEQKNQMLLGDIQSLQAEHLESMKRMTQMEDEFQQRLEQISESAVSKEEMESILERESMRHQLAMQEVEARNSQMASKIELMSEKNAQLLQQMQESREEQKRQEKLLQERMEEWKRQKEEEEKKRMQRELESKSKWQEVVALLVPIATVLAPVAQECAKSLMNAAISSKQNASESKTPGSAAQFGNSTTATSGTGASNSATAAQPAFSHGGPSRQATGFGQRPSPPEFGYDRPPNRGTPPISMRGDPPGISAHGGPQPFAARGPTHMQPHQFRQPSEPNDCKQQ